MRKLASIQKVAGIADIKGADRIELIKILGWNVVAKKDTHKKGELVLYIEIDSLLPECNDAWKFLSKNSTKTVLIDGKSHTGYRIKTIKLRNTVSQGLVIPITAVKELAGTELKEGQDVTEILGIVKYEKPVHVSMKQQAYGERPPFVPKTDEDRIQICPEVLEMTGTFYVTEKLDGTSISIYSVGGKNGVCSRNLDLKESGGGAFWEITRKLKVLENIAGLDIVLQGELVGSKIQGNPYKINGHKIYFYNIFFPNEGRFGNYAELYELTSMFDLDIVPLIDDNFKLPNTVDKIVEYTSSIKSDLTDIHEGVVIRSHNAEKRISFKVINPDFLLK